VNMYKRILLAYDGSVEGRTALREGALLAKQCGAEVFLLSVLTDTGTRLLSEVTLVGATVQMEEDFRQIDRHCLGCPWSGRPAPPIRHASGRSAVQIDDLQKQVKDAAW
jgi:nucleotide-binding universal stress UspA family protein